MQGVENVKEYWDNRYSKQGELTTGYIGHNAEQNEQCYQERKGFIMPIVDKYIGNKTVLDYGCGVGQYFEVFRPYNVGHLSNGYIGYDINEWAIRYCIDKYLDDVTLFNTDFVLDEPLSCEVLFTATVLQHNTDTEVDRILSRYQDAETFMLYEFTGVTNAPHMAERSVNDYAKLVARSANKKLIEEHTHNVHGEQHSLMIFQ